jgi:hypothetical protein
MISPFSRNDTVEIVVPNSKYRQYVAPEKSKIYASVANGSHPPRLTRAGAAILARAQRDTNRTQKLPVLSNSLIFQRKAR